MTRAAFFDLDRTLVRINTGTRYVRWRTREGDMGWRELTKASFWALQYKFGVVDIEKVAAAVGESLAGIDEDAFRARCARWVEEEILPEITDDARRAVDSCRSAGMVPVMLTSSSPYIADPVASHLGLEHVLATRLEVEAGRFTGGLLRPFCYAEGKVVWARRLAEERDIDLGASRFYTDSVSDRPMLEAVGEPRVVNPDPRLARLARRRGWPIERW